MKKSWNLIPKILSKEKTIESRWYKNKAAPWGRIKAGDTVWFKNAGEPITVRAKVSKVLQFEHFSSNELRALIKKYGGNPGIAFQSDPKQVFDWAKGKRYVILAFLKNPQSVEPFGVSKKGFGSACAWMAVPSIQTIKI